MSNYGHLNSTWNFEYERFYNVGGDVGGSESNNTAMMHHRFLAGGEVAPKVDYAILGIVVITLALVLLVEAVRHSVSYFSCVPLIHFSLEWVNG